MATLDRKLKSRDITLPTKVHLVKSTVFPIVMWGCDNWTLQCSESWAMKNWFFWSVVLEKILQNPLNCKEIKPVNPKWDQSWKFIGRIDAEAEAPILWPPDVKSWLIRKYPNAGKGWKQEKGTTEDEIVGWHYWLKGHAFEQALGVGDGQESLECCSPWDCKELDMPEWLNWLTDFLSYRSHGPISLLLASGSWRSEGLSAWSFSVVLPIQALKVPP